MKALRIIVLIGILLILFILVWRFVGPARADSKSFSIAFYNVENLFDTINDQGTRDGEFTPEGKNQWTAERYQTKLDRLSQVISSMIPESFPTVIGLCEVENRGVLEDLVKHHDLKKANYQIIHYESPDERGIDNALLYRKGMFKPIHQEAIVNTFPFRPKDRTRDILYVKGIPTKSKKDTLHIFVNHWPSRYGGREKSAPSRNHVATIHRALVDSIFNTNPKANLVITGDFNDEPADSSLLYFLEAQALQESVNNSELYNLMYADYEEGRGTIYWRSWDMFDMFILSGNLLLKNEGIVLKEKKGQIFDAEFLLFKNDNGSTRPNRTMGKEYYGGYSDHLPVFIEFDIVK